MKKWKVTKPRSVILKNQVYVIPVIDEDGKKEEVLFYATNPNILNQVVAEHNKLVSIFENSIKKKA